MQWFFVKFLEPVAVRCADLVFGSDQWSGKYVKGLGARNIEVTPNGVDVNLFKPGLKGYTLKGVTFFKYSFRR